MHLRQLGNSGLTVSVVGLGCNNFGGRMDAAATESVVNTAIDAGITLFDTADIYGNRGQSEELLGAALAGRRNEVVLATKFGVEMGEGPDFSGGSRRYIRRAVEASLRRLRTDHIDLYQLHRPDPLTPIEETLRTLDDLVREGKVGYVGSSNFSGWQIADADWVARTRSLSRFISAQNHYSLLEREAEADVIPACEQYEVGILPYFPLASGMLTGKYRRGAQPPVGTRLAGGSGEYQWLTERNFDVVEGLQALAADLGVGILDIAIGGLAAQPQVSSVIAGATTPEQVLANVAAGEWRPDAEALRRIDTITHPRT